MTGTKGAWHTRFRMALLMAVLVLPVAIGGCNSDPSASSSGEEPAPDIAVTLPFGVEHVEGSASIGRPAIYEHVPFTYNGEPVEARTLWAAYRVVAPHPAAVFREWVDQLDRLALDRVVVRSSRSRHDPWLEATGITDSSPGDSARLELWLTEREPILLVRLNRISSDEPRRPTVDDDAGQLRRRTSAVSNERRTAGDVLFTEQGDSIHLPTGTRALMPTIPTWSGTGGTTSVLAATSSRDAAQALLDEATRVDPSGEITLPLSTTRFDGVEVLTAHYEISAGGWGFSVVSVRGDDDPYATVYVSSYAD